MPYTIQRSFTGGELAPSLRARADLVKYANGLAKCENFLIRPQGGAYNRAGFVFCEELGDSSTRGRLIPFEFSSDDSVVLVFQDSEIRFIKDKSYIDDGGSPYSIVSPFLESELVRVQYTQDADTMTLTHPNHPPQILSRFSDTNWTIAPINFTADITPPSFVTNLTVSMDTFTHGVSLLITTAAAHGLVSGEVVTFSNLNITGIDSPSNIAAVTLTNLMNDDSFELTVVSDTSFYLPGIDTSAAVYSDVTINTADVDRNALTTVGSGGGTFTKKYNYVVSTVDAAGVESVPSTEVSITTNTLASTFGVQLNWSPVVGASYYRVYKDNSEDSGVYGWIGDSKSDNFIDYNIAPDTSDAPLEARDPFDSVNNYPATVGFYQQRLFFANTNEQVQTVFSTRTGEFNSLRSSSPARADDAITFTINGRQVNEVRHIISIDSLLLLTSGGEWLVSEGQDQVLTPSTLGVRPQGYNGANWTTPAVLPNSFMYVQNKGNKIRNISYSATNLSYGDSDVSLISEHLFDGYEITEMTYAAEPYGIMWCIRNDGALLGLTYQSEQQISAWHQHNTDGSFESIATIGETDTDTLYAIVNRTVNGQTVRYVEYMTKRFQDAPENAVYLDSAFVYDGSTTDIISGVHLFNAEVTAVIDGNVFEGLTVTAGGVLQLPLAGQKVTIGLPYVPALETLDIDSAEGVKGNKVNVSDVRIVMEKSRGGWVSPLGDDGTAECFQEIKPRFDSDGYGTIQLKSQQFEVNIEKQWRRGGGIRIEQRTPMPMGILAIIPKIDVSS